MSGLEVVAAVAAVISAFHGGSELLKIVKEKRRARKARDLAQQEWEEEQLQTSLVIGKQQIDLRYKQDQRELGDYVRIGDDIARDRLYHVALILQAEIINSLKLAATNEFCVLNLRLLHEASITNRRETIVTLDELKQRIYVTRPMARPLKDTFQASAQTMQTNNYNTTSSMRAKYFPQSDNYSSQLQSRDTRHDLTEYCRADGRRAMSAAVPCPNAPIQAAEYEPNIGAVLEGLRPDHRVAIMKDIQQMIETYQNLSVDDRPDAQRTNNDGHPTRRDTLAMLHGDDPYEHDRIVDRDPQQVFRRLPPTLKEQDSATNPVSAQREPHLYNQPYATRNQNPHMKIRTTQPRWSDVSESSLADSTAASLNSNSSQGSLPQVSPLASHRSPRTDPTRIPAVSAPPNTPYQQIDKDRCASSSAPAQHAASEDKRYTPSHTAPLHTRTQSNVPPSASPRSDANVHVPPTANGDTGSAMHVPWPGTQQYTDSPPITQYTSPQRYSVDEGVGATQPTQPQYWVSPPTATHRATNSEYSARPTGFAVGTATASTPGSTNFTKHPRNASIPPSIASTNSSSSVSIGILPGHCMRPNIRTDTIQSGHTHSLSGRPNKDNDYWGFCKGAWAAREDPKKGIKLRTQPHGYYNHKQIWACSTCTFTGEVFKAPDPKKKSRTIEIFDPRVKVSMSGIRYRWVFLAKSHVKKKAGDPSSNDDNFGCVLCSAEGNVTGVYGGVETLMNHIALTHVGNMSDATRKKVDCVLGRVAGNGESFDINVPIFAQVEELAS